MRKSSIVLVGLIALSLWAATVYGQHRFGRGPMGPGGMMGDGPGMMFPMLFKKMDPTPEQEAQVRKIMDDHRGAFRTLFEQLQAAHEGMADKLFTLGEVKDEDLAPQVQRISDLRKQLMQEGLKVTLEMRGVLTPEQLAKAAELKKRMQALHAEMRGLFEEKE